jgi:hypothetical protein
MSYINDVIINNIINIHKYRNEFLVSLAADPLLMAYRGELQRMAELRLQKSRALEIFRVKFPQQLARKTDEFFDCLMEDENALESMEKEFLQFLSFKTGLCYDEYHILSDFNDEHNKIKFTVDDTSNHKVLLIRFNELRKNFLLEVAGFRFISEEQHVRLMNLVATRARRVRELEDCDESTIEFEIINDYEITTKENDYLYNIIQSSFNEFIKTVSETDGEQAGEVGGTGKP